MLYEFAMTPDLFDAPVQNTDRGKTLGILLRGIADNGLLSNLHNVKWFSNEITDRISVLPQDLKDKLHSCISVLEDRHRFVRHPRHPNGNHHNNIDWLNYALDSHSRIPFHAIFLSQKLINESNLKCDAFVEINKADDSSQWLNSNRRTLSLKKSPEDFTAALTPILRYAITLDLVDAYMNCKDNRFFDTVKICSKLMGQRGHNPLPGRIHIHAELKKQKPVGHDEDIHYHLDHWERKLRPLIKDNGHRFKVFLWEGRRNSQTMYDSYILTDQCGIFLHRLDCRTGTSANDTNWLLLDDEARIHHLNNYRPQLSPFNFKGSIEVPKNKPSIKEFPPT